MSTHALVSVPHHPPPSLRISTRYYNPSPAGISNTNGTTLHPARRVLQHTREVVVESRACFSSAAMNADSIISEINNISVYLTTHGATMEPEQLTATTASMARSVLLMISGLKHLPAITATSLASAITSSVFSDGDKQQLQSATNTKMVTGCAGGSSRLPPQKFADPPDSQNLFTATDWAVFNDAAASRTLKLETVVSRCHRIGIDNPDQTAKCDLAVVLAVSHYRDEAAPRVLFDLANDVETMFDKMPSPFIGAISRFLVVPAVANMPPDVVLHAWEGVVPLRDVVSNWAFARAKIASRVNSKMLRGDSASSMSLFVPGKRGSPRSGSSPAFGDPQSMFQMGLMLAQAQTNPAMRAQMATMLGVGDIPRAAESGVVGGHGQLPGLQIFNKAGAASSSLARPDSQLSDGRDSDGSSAAMRCVLTDNKVPTDTAAAVVPHPTPVDAIVYTPIAAAAVADSPRKRRISNKMPDDADAKVIPEDAAAQVTPEDAAAKVARMLDSHKAAVAAALRKKPKTAAANTGAEDAKAAGWSKTDMNPGMQAYLTAYNAAKDAGLSVPDRKAAGLAASKAAKVAAQAAAKAVKLDKFVETMGAEVKAEVKAQPIAKNADKAAAAAKPAAKPKPSAKPKPAAKTKAAAAPKKVAAKAAMKAIKKK